MLRPGQLYGSSTPQVHILRVRFRRWTSSGRWSLRSSSGRGRLRATAPTSPTLFCILTTCWSGFEWALRPPVRSCSKSSLSPTTLCAFRGLASRCSSLLDRLGRDDQPARQAGLCLVGRPLQGAGESSCGGVFSGEVAGVEAGRVASERGLGGQRPVSREFPRCWAGSGGGAEGTTAAVPPEPPQREREVMRRECNRWKSGGEKSEFSQSGLRRRTWTEGGNNG